MMSFKSVCIVALLAAIATSTTTPARAADTEAASRRIDIEHIALDLRFDTSRKTAAGVATLRLRTTSPADRIALDAVGLRISSVDLAGVGPARFTISEGREDGALEIQLNRSYAPSEPFELRIRYATTAVNESDPANIWGSVGQGLRFLTPSATDPRRRVQIWSSNGAHSNRRWFPGYDRPDDLRTFELTATVDAGLAALSNGVLVERRTNSDGAETFHWRLDQPQQNYRSAIVVGRYENAPVRLGARTLNNYGYPDEMAGVVASTERLADMASFFSATIGRPLPASGYTQVFVQELSSTMSNTGLATLTENFVDSAEVHRDFLYLWDDVEAESLAEQWFGNEVAPASWEDGWLMRALPRYLATLYNARRNGEAEVLTAPYHTFGDLQTMLSDWDNGVREAIAPGRLDAPDPFLAGNTPYMRGAMALRLLELEIGRPALLRAIRQFARARAGAFATTEDFQAAVSSAARRDMAWFFNQWLRRVDHPVLTVAHRYDAAGRRLIVEVDQASADSENTNLFSGAVEIEIDGRVERVAMLPQQRNSFVFVRRTRPHFVNFDYKSRWLARITHPQSVAENLALIASSTDALARRNAMVQLADAARSADATPETRSRVIQTLREAMEGRDYWRLKGAALAQLQRVLNPEGNAERAGLDTATEAALVRIIRGVNRDEAWVRLSALNWLGATRDRQYADLYLSLLRDPSDRVIYAAAIALGKTGDPRAFDALVALEPHPSWKNQSRIAMIEGLAELGDPRGVDIVLRAFEDLGGARWTLVTPIWDYRLAAAGALQRLNGGARAYPLARRLLDQAMAEGQVNDVVYNATLMASLADPRGRDAFAALRTRYASDPAMLEALEPLAQQLESALAPASG